MRRRERKHRTPVVRTIRVTVGSESASFRLQTERLAERKAAVSAMAKMRDEAKSILALGQAPHPLSPSDLPLHSDFDADPLIDWRIAPDELHFHGDGAQYEGPPDAFDFIALGVDVRMDEALGDDGLRGHSFIRGSDAAAFPLDLGGHVANSDGHGSPGIVG
jgi:hypothetical protein